MNITGNYPIWEWERRCRPRGGGGVCGRSGKYDYNKLSKKNRSLKRLIWDKNGQKPAWGKNSFIFQATYRPDGIRQRGSRVPAIRGFQRSFTQPGPGRDRRPRRPRAGREKKPMAARIAGARHIIYPGRKRSDHRAPPRPPGRLRDGGQDKRAVPHPLVPAGAYPGERVVDRNRTGNVFHRIRPYVEQRPAFIGVLL